MPEPESRKATSESYLGLSICARIDPARREDIEDAISKVLGCDGVWLGEVDDDPCPLVSFASTLTGDVDAALRWLHGDPEDLNPEPDDQPEPKMDPWGRTHREGCSCALCRLADKDSS